MGACHDPRKRLFEVFEVGDAYFIIAAEADRRLRTGSGLSSATGLAPDALVCFVELYGHIEMPGAVRPGVIASSFRNVDEFFDATTGNILVLRPAGPLVGREATTTRRHNWYSTSPAFTVEDACIYVYVDSPRIEDEFTKTHGVGSSNVMGVQFLASAQASQMLDTSIELAPDALVCVVVLHGQFHENLTYQEVAERGGIENRHFRVLHLAFDARTGNFLAFHIVPSSILVPQQPKGVPAITPTRDSVPSVTEQHARNGFNGHGRPGPVNQPTVTDVIKPCAAEFYPQTTLKHAVVQATADRLYFLSGVHLYALNAGTGALQWGLLISDSRSRLSQEGAPDEPHAPERPAPPKGAAGGQHLLGGLHAPDGLRGLAVQNDRVFVTTMHSSTYAFIADSGTLMWQHSTRGDSIPTLSGDTLYVPSGGMYALSTHDGSERWAYPTRDGVTTTPVIVDDTLYAGSYGDTVYALDATAGNVRWIYPTYGRVYVAPIVNQGVVYAGIGNAGARLFAIDAKSGKLIWKTTMVISSMAQLIIAGGVLYTSQNNNSLVGINLQNGEVMWRKSGIPRASFLEHDSVLYVTSVSGDVYAFETQTRQLIWQEHLRTLGAGDVSRMKLIGEELYVGFNDLGKIHFVSIHAINSRTGREDWSTTVNWNVSTLDLA